MTRKRAVDLDRLAERVLAGEEVRRDGLPDDDDALVSVDLVRGEEPAARDLVVARRRYRWCGSEELADVVRGSFKVAVTGALTTGETDLMLGASGLSWSALTSLSVSS